MTKIAHRLYIAILALIVLIFLVFLIIRGFSYYNTVLEERFFHTDHNVLKPSGVLGHGLGIFGSLCMVIGVSTYMVRKRSRKLSRLGLLKHWLEFHIFLCTLGPVMVLFHTAFKFGGLVAVSFWSMVAVFLSGIAGRFIYIQIPRSIEGRELSLGEIREMKGDIGSAIRDSYRLDEESFQVIIESTRKKIDTYQPNILKRTMKNFLDDRRTLKGLRSVLKRSDLSRSDNHQIMRLVKNEISLNRRIERLVFMQNLFKYWHVAHLPFALVMLIIMIIHVGVTIAFGYKWLF